MQMLSIRTSRPEVQQAVGCDIYVIAGIGKPRQYYLWEVFTVEAVHRHRLRGADELVAVGTGWQLAPPQRLEGARFETFRRSCCNFVSFRRIDTMPYHDVLRRLADDYRPPGTPAHCAAFYSTLLDLLPPSKSGPSSAGRTSSASLIQRPNVLEALERTRPMRALSIRQPHAEAILRGIKSIEYRSGPTRVRGRIWIYSSQVRYPADEEEAMMHEYGIADVACAALPRGVLLGTVDLWKCDGGHWYIQDPRRARRLLRPTRKPQPKWFYPFEEDS